MNSTLESCAPYKTLIASLPGDVQQFIYALDADAQRFRQIDPAYARQVRTDRINAGLEEAYQDFHRTIEAHPLRNRTTVFTSKLESAFQRGDYYGLNSIPKRHIIRSVVIAHASTTP